MAYKKKTGAIICRFTGYTPLWIDAVMGKSGEKITIFLNTKMSEKFKKVVDDKIQNKHFSSIFASKMEDAGYYRFTCFCNGKNMGARAKLVKKIAYENLERTLDEGINAVRAHDMSQKLVVGRAGLNSWGRTGNKISNALANCVDRSKEFAEKAEKLRVETVKREKKKLLTKLRRKYFYDRELQPNLTDAQWDEYLIATYSEYAEPPIQTDSEFEAKLREAGLL